MIVSDALAVQCPAMAGETEHSDESAAAIAPTERASALCEYMDELIESLRKDVPSALKEFDEDAIHDTRVATRRLKAAIDLLEPVLNDEHRKPVAKAGKKLRRRLGPMRDLDVMIDGLEPIKKLARHKQAAQWLQDRLNAARDEARAAAKKSSSPNRLMARLGNWWGLREDVIDAGSEASTLLTKSLHLQLDQFAAQATWLAAYMDNPDGVEKRDPHQLRIAGKALRYTLEMAKREGFVLKNDVAKTFKKLQEALGDWHDLVVLTERALQESLEALLAHHDPALQRRVLALSKLTLDRADLQLRRFNLIWAKKSEALLATIRDAVPVTADAKQPKTDPDPADSGESSDLEAASEADHATT